MKIYGEYYTDDLEWSHYDVYRGDRGNLILLLITQQTINNKEIS